MSVLGLGSNNGVVKPPITGGFFPELITVPAGTYASLNYGVGTPQSSTYLSIEVKSGNYNTSPSTSIQSNTDALWQGNTATMFAVEIDLDRSKPIPAGNATDEVKIQAYSLFNLSSSGRRNFPFPSSSCLPPLFYDVEITNGSNVNLFPFAGTQQLTARMIGDSTLALLIMDPSQPPNGRYSPVTKQNIDQFLNSGFDLLRIKVRGAYLSSS
jgi:hypothetical protein